MNGKIEITKGMMEAARDYVPLTEKEAWVAENAPKCFDKLQITADDEPMPPMYMVNTGLKSRYLMAALARLYFRAAPVDAAEDEQCMSVEEYDAWAGSHVMNQLERWKRDDAFRAKTYDLLFDYKDLEKRFSTQLSGLLAVQNDPVIRQAQQSAVMLKDFPAVLEQLKAMQEEKQNGE